jgi:hypothetical protein
MSKKNQHVVPYQEGWAVKGERNGRATSVHPTQRKAVEAAKQTAIKNSSELFSTAPR